MGLSRGAVEDHCLAGRSGVPNDWRKRGPGASSDRTMPSRFAGRISTLSTATMPRPH